ncbi:MAG: hypothetical protein HQ477_00215 [Chloroflexi bacterium]|nr:hypothetical protein [Chloroflexota bacterium]
MFFKSLHNRGIAMVFLFVLATVLVVTASFGVKTVHADGDVIASIVVPERVSISAGSDARDRWNALIEVRGGVVAIGSPGELITVPVAVASGWWLDSLTDPTSGITIVRGDNETVLRIPIRDAGGNDTIRVLVNTSDFIGDGWQATATINSMSIDLPTRSRDFTDVDAEVGVASVKILGAITGFPSGSSMDMSIAKVADADVLNTVSGLAAAGDLEIADIAYVVGLAKTKLDGVLGEMTLRLTVGKPWVDKHGLENVRVVRISDEGTVQTFNWVAVDPDVDPIQFNLVSPDGLSKFVIEALRKAQATPTPTLVPTEVPTATTVPPTPTLVPTVSPTATTVPPTLIAVSATSVHTATTVPASASPPISTAPSTATSTVSPTNTVVVPTNALPTAELSSTDAEEITEVASGSSCNAAIPSRSTGIGQIAFLLFPIGLIAYKNRFVSKKRK